MSEEQGILLREREPVKGVEWKVWRRGDELVKEYRIVGFLGHFKRRWRKEHRALRRLNRRGVPSPPDYGFDSPRRGEVRFRHGYVDGEVLHGLDNCSMEELADLFLSIHRARVTSGDAAEDNLLMSDRGELMLIDFGRARVFVLRSPLFYFNVGKELARIRKRLLAGDPGRWREFLRAYRAKSTDPAWGRRLIERARRYWMRRWGLRD